MIEIPRPAGRDVAARPILLAAQRILSEQPQCATLLVAVGDSDDPNRPSSVSKSGVHRIRMVVLPQPVMEWAAIQIRDAGWNVTYSRPWASDDGKAFDVQVDIVNRYNVLNEEYGW